MDTPDILLPYQQQWAADRESLKLCVKARRIGITWTEAADDVLTAATAGPDGMDVLYIGYNQDMTKEFIETCAWWAKQFQVAAGEMEEALYDEGTGEDKDILTFTIRFKSGHKIMGLSSAPRNLRGKQGRVVIDEAAYHDNLMALIKASIAMKVWGGETRVISTHNGVDNEFNQLVEEVETGRRPGSVHRYTFDDAIADGLCKRIFYMQGLDWSPEAEAAWRQAIIDEYGDDANEELFCVPTKSGGAYLPAALIESCMYQAPVVRLELPEEFTWRPAEEREEEVLQWCKDELQPLLDKLPIHLPHAFGEDFGRTADLTALVPFTIEQNLVRRVPFVAELRRVPYKQQEQIVLYLLQRLPRFVKGCFDATGNGEALAEAMAQFFGQSRIELVHFSEKVYRETLPKLKAGMEDRMVMVPRDLEVKDDLRMFQTIDGVPKLPKAKRGKGPQAQRHGDVAIGILLGYHASTLDHIPVGEYRAATPAAVARLNKGRVARPVKITAGFSAHKGIW